jgi:hypothetical protein
VGGIVAVDGHLVAAERVVLRPQQEADVLDAVLGQPRCVGKSAEREVDLKSGEIINFLFAFSKSSFNDSS